MFTLRGRQYNDRQTKILLVWAAFTGLCLGFAIGMLVANLFQDACR
jgi:small-conductance mechanosensitive channel